MKKFLSLLLLTIMTFTLISCDKSKTPENENKATSRNFTVALAADITGINDKSFNQGIWEGLKRFASDTNTDCNYVQTNTDADYAESLASLSEEGADVIVVPGILLEEALKTVATQAPDSHFLMMDGVIDMPNIASVVFSENEGGYLVGIAAAEKAKEAGKNKVGFIGGANIPVISKFEAGFETGVKSVDPNMIIESEYIGDFKNTNKAQEIANNMYDDGVYVIFHAAGKAGNGLIDEAKDRRTNGEDVWAIGVDKNQYDEGIYEEGKSCILTSSVKRVDIATYEICMQAYKGDFPGGKTIVFDIKNGGIDIPEENPNLDKAILDKINQAKEAVKDGKIVVSSVPSRQTK